MNRKIWSGVLGFALAVVMGPAGAWAETSTAAATVSVTIASRATLTLTRDLKSSVTRFSAGQVVFDRTDDQDGQGESGQMSFMYAPYRSEVNMNWHEASIIANGTSMSLTASVTGTVGTKNLADVLYVWFGGLCNDKDCNDEKYTEWKLLTGLNVTHAGTYSGVAPFNYKLDVSGVSAGTYANGNITYTLTSN